MSVARRSWRGAVVALVPLHHGARCQRNIIMSVVFKYTDMDTFRLGLAARRRERERLPAEVAHDHTRWTGRGTLEGG
jgi:hypothetical protein